MSIGKTCVAIATLLGIGMMANGLVMLVTPGNWYFAVPGVSTTGPFNQHFIRDIGMIYLLLGTAFVVGAARREVRPLLWTIAAIWMCGHALFHLWQVVVGICGTDALEVDFPGVTFPALLTAVLACWSIADARRTALTQRTFS